MKMVKFMEIKKKNRDIFHDAFMIHRAILWRFFIKSELKIFEILFPNLWIKKQVTPFCG